MHELLSSLSNALSNLTSCEYRITKKELVYQAMLADNSDFDEILISPVMIQDHMPDKLLDALEKLQVNTGPPKPNRKADARNNNYDATVHPLLQYSPAMTPSSLDRTPSHRVVLETSFTDLQPVGVDECDAPKQMVKPSLMTALRYHKKLHLLRDAWPGPAPLASPETLTDTSSLSSLGLQVKSCIALPPQMDTISQSPNSMKSQQSSARNATPSPLANGSQESPKVNSVSITGSCFSEASTRRLEDETHSVSPSAACARSEVSLQELIDAFSSGKTSPGSRDLRHVTFATAGELEPLALVDMEEDGESSPLSVRSDEDGEGLSRPLRRSCEEINLSALDDTQQVFAEGRAPSPRRALSSSGHMSPASLLLFQKLLTIESPTD